MSSSCNQIALSTKTVGNCKFACRDIIFKLSVKNINSGKMLESLKELARFLWKTKKWWLIPVILLIILIALLIIASFSNPLPVFIYPLV
jgi:hypothetical protein